MQPNSPAYSHNSQLASLEILAIQHSPPLVLSRPYGTLEPFLSANYTLGFLFRKYCVSIYFVKVGPFCCSRVFSEPATGNALDNSLTPPYNGVVLELTHVYEHIKSSKTGIFFAGVNILTLSRIKVSCLVFRAEFLPI